MAEKRVLVIDVGGTNIKVLVSGATTSRKVASGPTLTPSHMVHAVKELTPDWPHDVVAIGFPGPVLDGKVVAEPHNLGRGWVGFDFEKAFGCPVRVMNDAAMQALGSYRGGRMLFLGLGTGLGSALIVDGVVEPLELAHLPYKKGMTYEDYLGKRGLERRGKQKWRATVEEVVNTFLAALQAEEVVLGGGNAKLLKELPRRARLGDNMNAFVGGFRLWEREQPPPSRPKQG